MSECITCINFIRIDKKCKQNNPMKVNPIIAYTESLFIKCSDYILNKDAFFAGKDVY